jgi:AcrR family transcriptional regulator
MAPATTSATTAPLGLRERKKLKTRQAIRHAAYRLFADRGYDATTVEQIAAAAEVSTSTFFRYFPTKEDVVVSDAVTSVMAAELRARPAGEPVVESLRHAVIQPLRELDAQARAEILHRLRLAREVPTLRARICESTAASCRVLVDVLAGRAGREQDDFSLRVLVGALLGGWQEAVMYWADTGGRSDLPELVDRALDVLATTLRG